ncbi:MAG: N-formylglutamate amidohydrolase, partial [Proteobacteria bacterium]|nr:N-formylglutamate amidohydrolase [Pseudomonadota bacterium]
VLFTSDHNGVAVPAALDGLGVPAHEMRRHAAYDIGIDAAAKILADRFDAPLVVSNYSRLVIDCNRHPGAAGSIPSVSDGTVVPANAAVSDGQRRAREQEIFHPYHGAIGARIQAMRARDAGAGPLIIALHSFTPIIAGAFRPWDIGILWKDDQRLARPLIEALATDPAIAVGDNQPYSGSDPAGYTVDHHVAPLKLISIGVEFRQDRIEFQAGAEEWAGRFGDALERVLEARPWEG